MRFPWAAALLVALVLAVYAYSSGGRLYPDASIVSQNAYGAANPLALLFSLFFHIGARHLLGNFFPLLAFAALVEAQVSGRHVLVVFLASGLVASLVFSVLNPLAFLAGASGGIAGLMTAGALLRPKHGFFLLLAVPFFLAVVAFPFLDWTVSASFSGLSQKAQALQEQGDALRQAGQLAEAQQAWREADAVNATLTQQQEVQRQEAEARTDFVVHLSGALVGAAYALVFFRFRVRDGFEEFVSWISQGMRSLGRRMD